MTDREKMIIEFYENGRIPLIFRLDMRIQELKYKWKQRKERDTHGTRHNWVVDTNWFNTIFNDGNSNARTNEMY